MKILSKQQTILIVDDSSEILDILSSILYDKYKVRAVTNGKRALEMARKSPPDLILLDISMPYMDGYEVCTQLKKEPLTESIPVIFVTGHNEIENETHGFELGAVDYITKPVSPVIVLARVHTHLSLFDQNRVLEQKVLERTKEISLLNNEIIKTQKEVIFTMGAIGESRSKETGNHVKRVAEYSRLFSIHYGLSMEEAELVKMASPMHDIGKVGIPDNVLKKQSKLTTEEFKVMKNHA